MPTIIKKGKNSPKPTIAATPCLLLPPAQKNPHYLELDHAQNQESQPDGSRSRQLGGGDEQTAIGKKDRQPHRLGSFAYCRKGQNDREIDEKKL